MPEIKMPQLGESVVEGTITRWLKKEGEDVGEDELLVEISTDKVDSEVPSSLSGKLTKILVPEGETVTVGTPIALIGEDGEAAADGAEPRATESSPEQRPQAGTEEPVAAPTRAAEAPPPAAAPAEPRAPAAQQPTAQQPAAPPEPAPTARSAAELADTARRSEQEPSRYERGTADAPGGDTSKRGIISPLVRRLADENDVDLAQIQGSGTGGRIRKQDVLRLLETREVRPAVPPAQEGVTRQAEAAADRSAAEPAEQAQPAAAAGREELVPWTNIRRRTAEHMVAAHLETARAWNAVEADWSSIVTLRNRAKDNFKQREGFSLTFMPFLARVICDTLLEMPEVNSSYDEANQANRIKHYVNLGIAVALEGGGLIVPVVKDADEKNLVGLARSITDVANRARSKKLAPDDLVGGSFTITNPGPFGSIISVPIIPRGQTAILGFEAIQKRVVVTDDDSIAIRSMGFLSMSWDHRAIDGAEAAKFLARLRERIETTDFAPELTHYL